MDEQKLGEFMGRIEAKGEAVGRQIDELAKLCQDRGKRIRACEDHVTKGHWTDRGLWLLIGVITAGIATGIGKWAMSG